MSRYAFLLLPSRNRVYADAAPALARAEFAVLAAVLPDGVIREESLAESVIGGVPYVTFEAGGLSRRDLESGAQPAAGRVRPRGDVLFLAKAGAPVTPLARFPIPAAALAALTAFVTGCGSTSSSVAGTALSSAAPAATASPPAPVTGSTVAGSTVTGSTVTGSTAPVPARVVYLAEGGSVDGTIVHAPACTTGCQLSGDSTTSLWDMTWPTWNSAVAVGTGTEKLDDCLPDCVTGTLHAVPVRVTMSRPVMVCVSGTGKWFWTRLSFTWPAGLPAAFSGGNAPLNPFGYQDIAARAAKSCH
jgi:hypothetical protein